jgi:chromodomain-helicase-DNA-binding protein 7
MSAMCGPHSLRKYHREHPLPAHGPFYNPNFEKLDRIIAMRNDSEFLVKWQDLDYNELTWETRDSIDDNLAITRFLQSYYPPSPSWFVLPPRPRPSDWQLVAGVEPSRSGWPVLDHQLDGLNFLAHARFNGRNTILADEMGLGKTAQAVLFLRHLFERQHIHGPFLVAAPLITMGHWQREIHEWSTLKFLSFYGIPECCQTMKKYEFFYENSRCPRFNVLLTTYEFIMKETEQLQAVQWRAMVIDEAHCLKNTESKLINTVRNYRADYKLLLTGTPLQNNIQELWTLLNLLDPVKFPNLQAFEHKFEPMGDPDNVWELTKMLEPIMLRRMKSDVEKAIAPLEEIIFECQMTRHQKAYYKAVFQNNIEYLMRGNQKGVGGKSRNKSMDLRKVCNHPYLIQGAEQQILLERPDLTVEGECLIRSAGKMILLDKLLAKLKADGHRVLIFSQMTRMLDLLADYLFNKEYQFERIDGGVRGDERQIRIDRFNAPDSQSFVFLLCTKAAGIGINLGSANVVIIYDSDWNPQNDIQAIARCHRIGQTREVKAYRFIIANSYERSMFDKASLKLGLHQAVLETSKNPKTELLDKLIRLGAYYALAERDDQATEQYNEDDIDTILSRSNRIRHERHGHAESTFSMAHFAIEEEEVPAGFDGPEFWGKFLPEQPDVPRSRDHVVARLPVVYDEGDREPDEELAGDIEFWTKPKFQCLMKVLVQFGYGRWSSLLEHSTLTCEIGEIRAVSHVILRWLLDSTTETQKTLEAVYKAASVKEFAKYEQRFVKKRKVDFEPLVIQKTSSTLKRLDLLHYLHRIVSTCPNPPEGLIIPDNIPSSIESWTREDDQQLLLTAWRHGYPNFCSWRELELPPKKALMVRIVAIVSGLKQLYQRFCERKTGEDVPFDHATLSAAASAWTKRDHKAIIHCLTNYGLPTMEEFREMSGLSAKPLSIIEVYVSNVIKSAEKGVFMPIIEPLTSATAAKIVARIDLFARVRDLCLSDLDESDRNLVDLISQSGFLKLQESPLIVDRFGAEGTERKVIKYLTKLVRKLPERPVPKTDLEDPIFPIQLSGSLVLVSLGTVIWDRDGFHNERYLYPPGFLSEKLYFSTRDPSEKVWYQSTILDRGDDQPVFRVCEKDHPEVMFEGNAPSNPWLAIVKVVNSKMDGKIASISGPECFGFAHPKVQGLMARMKNAYKCRKFRRKATESEPEEDEKAAEKPKVAAKRAKMEKVPVTAPASPAERKPVPERRLLVVDFGKLLTRIRGSDQAYDRFEEADCED